MGFFRGLAKVPATLIGLALTLAGVGGFFYGLFLIFGDKNTGQGVLIMVGAIIALAIGTVLGKFARGDYD